MKYVIRQTAGYRQYFGANGYISESGGYGCEDLAFAKRYDSAADAAADMRHTDDEIITVEK